MMVNRMFLHFELGMPITGGVIAKVVKSNSINFKENDIGLVTYPGRSIAMQQKIA